MTDWMQAGKTAVITGAAGGIGFETARRFINAGMNVAIADVKETLPQAHEQLVALAGNADRVMAETCNVADREAMQGLQEKVAARFGPVHCLMNNAGIATRGAKPWEGLDGLNHILGINFMGVVHGCHAPA